MRSSGGSDGKHTIHAEATSGAAASGDIGIAGALAINIISSHTEAIIRGNPAHAPPTTSMLEVATSRSRQRANEADTAKATSEAAAGSDGAGIGASVALNIFDPTITRAEVEEGARFSAADDVTITASGDAHRRDDGRRRLRGRHGGHPRSRTPREHRRAGDRAAGSGLDRHARGGRERHDHRDPHRDLHLEGGGDGRRRQRSRRRPRDQRRARLEHDRRDRPQRERRHGLDHGGLDDDEHR